MKFKNGHWMIKSYIKPLYGVGFYSAKTRGDTLQVIVSTVPVEHRAQTLEPALLVELSSPMEGVIRVTAVHHKGAPDPAPHFAMNAQPPRVDIYEDDSAIRYTSGALTAAVRKGKRGWGIDFYQDGKRLTGNGTWQSLAHLRDTRKNYSYMADSLELSVGEAIYGFGELFGPFVKNGQAIDTWMADGGTCSEQAYKCIPFYLSNRGYGVFVDSARDVHFEVGSENVERVNMAVKGEVLSYLVIAGPGQKDVLRRYTALLGRPALPPAWSMGLWLSTSFTTDYSEDIVCGQLIEGMRRRDIPLHVFHYDCFWMKGYHWCDFLWDEAAFPDPEGMLRRLKRQYGLHICLWLNPYIGQSSHLFDEGMAKGYLVRRTDGTVWQSDMWQSGMALVDFTNPEACRWYQSQLKRLLDMGVDAFKTDFGERIPVRDIAWHDGGDPLKMHNYYTFLYNRTVFSLLEETRGKGEAVLYARSATAGGQTMPAHWGGDCLATFSSMAEQIRGGLSLAACGFGFWSHDIGGFEFNSSADVYKRWCAFGLLTSHSRLHGSADYRVPWLYDEESCDVLRHFTRLKCHLMPYLYAKAVESHQTGTPMMRPMVMEFMDDPACATLDRQYMLGDQLLVAPILCEEGEVSYYLPEGTWTHLLDGSTRAGGRWYREQYGYMSLPLFVRPGALLAWGAQGDRPDYDYLDGLTLRAFPLHDGARTEATVYDTKGRVTATAAYSRAGDAYTVCCTARCALIAPDGARRMLAADTPLTFACEPKADK